MIKKIIKLLIPIIALIIGVAGGTFLKPSPGTDHNAEAEHSAESHDTEEAEESSDLHETPETHAGQDAHAKSDQADQAEDGHDDHGQNSGSEVAWFNFSRQFFVPLMRHGDGAGIIIMSMALETDTNNLQSLNDQELRLRDIILRQLLIAANTGRFDGNFTTDGRMRGLRKQVLAALQEVYGNRITAVLIPDIARQDEH